MLKSILTSLFWATLALCWTLFIGWDLIDLSKATYVLLTYSTFVVSGQFIALLFFTKDEKVHKHRKRIEQTLATIVFALGLWLSICWVLTILSAILFKELSMRTDGWDIPSDFHENRNWFWRISVEHWGLIAILITKAVWQSVSDFRRIDRNNLDYEKYEERLERRNQVATYGILGVAFVLMGFPLSGDHDGLYLFLIAMFFLPWTVFESLFEKIYYEYWKLN